MRDRRITALIAKRFNVCRPAMHSIVLYGMQRRKTARTDKR